MIRLFEQHEVRDVKELEGMWDFVKADTGKHYTLPVPGCWEQHPEMLTYRGQGSFSKKIRISKNTAVRLEFKGVSHTADVYWDGEKIAHHYNAFTPFSAVVPKATAGEHEIRVDVDNSFSEKSALHVGNDYYTYGGLIRPVVLEELSSVYIERVHFTPSFADGVWSAKLEVTVSNVGELPAEFVLAGALTEQDGEEVEKLRLLPGRVEAGESVTLESTQIYPGVKAWCHEEPNLYLLKVRLYMDQNEESNGESVFGRKEAGEVKKEGIPDKEENKDKKEAMEWEPAELADDLIERVGFRVVSIQGRKLQVNGKDVFLKGFNRHEDHGMAGCAIPLQLMVQDMELMEDMRANAVRTCHYPNDERFLDLCDERGIMVWEENHARGFTLDKMMNPNFDRQCEDCIREMILNHYNHPGIVIWGLLNECASETKEGREKYAKQYAQVRSMDQSRPVTSATCRHFNDICLDLPDIVSYNMYSGWYVDVDVKERHEQLMDWIEGAGGAGKPVIVSEFGAAAMYGYRDRGRCKWSEERQADIIRANLDAYKDDSRLTGVFIWQFADCRVTEEEGWFASRARCHNNKGVVDEYRRPKMAYDVVRELYPKMNGVTESDKDKA